MGIAENKASGRKIVDAINSGSWGVFDEQFAKNYVDHGLPPGLPSGVEGLKAFFGGFKAAFPDLKYSLDDEVIEGDKAVHRVTGRGTMKGEFQGMKPSGKTATWSEMHFVRFDANSKIVEHWANTDQLGMLTQLGFGPKA